MLTPPVIKDLRVFVARALGAGLVQLDEVPALSRALGALEVEERLFLEAQKKTEPQA